MDTSKNQSGLKNEKATGRRSFIRKMGTVMTTGVVVSAMPAVAKPGKPNDISSETMIGELSERIAILEAEKSIAGIYQNYESLLNDGNYAQIPELFARDGECVYNGGVFRGRDNGLDRLYNIRFRNGLTGKKLDLTPDCQDRQSIDMSKDHLSALAVFPYAMQAGSPMVADGVLVKMARLHGGGINKWIETGMCELSLTRKSREDAWVIKRLEYRTESGSIPASTLTKVFPADPEGPDELVYSPVQVVLVIGFSVGLFYNTCLLLLDQISFML